MKRASLFVCVFLLASRAAFAAVTVSPADALGGIVLVPGKPSPMAIAEETITVTTPAGAPRPGAFVELRLTPASFVCPGAVLTGTTNAAGQVVLRCFGGGEVSFVPGAAEILVDGVLVRSYPSVKSPDFDGVGADGRVDLVDLIAFSTCFFSGGPGCHDYDNDGTTGLSDLIVFAEAFTKGSHCP